MRDIFLVFHYYFLFINISRTVTRCITTIAISPPVHNLGECEYVKLRVIIRTDFKVCSSLSSNFFFFLFIVTRLSRSGRFFLSFLHVETA